MAVAHKHVGREALEVYGTVVAPTVGQVPFCLRLPQLVPIRARNMRNPSSGPAAGTPQGDFLGGDAIWAYAGQRRGQKHTKPNQVEDKESGLGRYAGGVSGLAGTWKSWRVKERGHGGSLEFAFIAALERLVSWGGRGPSGEKIN